MCTYFIYLHLALCVLSHTFFHKAINSVLLAEFHLQGKAISPAPAFSTYTLGTADKRKNWFSHLLYLREISSLKRAKFGVGPRNTVKGMKNGG